MDTFPIQRPPWLDHLGVVLCGLKAAEMTDLSWWLVSLPLWGPMLVLTLTFACFWWSAGRQKTRKTKAAPAAPHLH
jgi:uncharacterized BrkB/YihY/UPF0761 family membrane protein